MIYQWAGINLGENVAMLLQKSMQKLAQTSGASQLRLWGKILGTERDYYIVEGVAATADEEEPNPEMEAKGTGVNKYTYWVCNCPSENKWTVLPNLLPGDISIARQIKFHFSGDLDRRIITNPFFKEKENKLLRAQIARISASTTLLPKGVKKVVVEGEGDEAVETREVEAVMVEDKDGNSFPFIPRFADMKNASSWVHHEANILRNNKTVHAEVVAPEGEEWDDARLAEEKKKQLAADPYEPRLKNITADAKVKGANAWTVRHYGDSSEYLAANESDIRQNYGVVVVKSNWWPGAVTFYTQEKMKGFNIYVGDGHKFEDKTYYPIAPPKMQADPEERPTYEEPNPTEAFLARKAQLEAQANAGQEE